MVFSCAAGGGGNSGEDSGIGGSPDAAAKHEIHEQVTTCDVAWAVDGVQPTVCEFACAVRPEHPAGTPKQCMDTDRPCYLGPACANATSPSDLPRNCDETFKLADGTSGCCVQRLVEPKRYVPTFYVCP